MHRLLIQERAPGGPASADRPLLDIYRYRAMVRAKTQLVAVLQEHDGIISLAKLAGALDNGVENRPDIGRRRRDHPEDVAATSLVSQSLRKIARLRLHFVKQT